MEYVIWGIPPGKTDETLLLVRPGNNPITCRETAERLLKILETQHQITGGRIQGIDLSTPDMARAFVKDFFRAINL